MLSSYYRYLDYVTIEEKNYMNLKFKFTYTNCEIKQLGDKNEKNFNYNNTMYFYINFGGM